MPKLHGFAPVPLPGPPPAPLLGHIPALIRFLDAPIETMERLRPHGDVVGLARDNPAIVCVFGAERNREVLSNPKGFPNVEDLLIARPGTPMSRLSRSIVNINGEVHKRHRRLMMPAFSNSALAQYAEDIVDIAERSVARWPIDEVVDLDGLLERIMVDVAMRTLFGLDPSRDSNELRDSLTLFVQTFSTPLALLLPYEIPGLPYRRAQQLAGRALATLDQLLAKKRREGPSDSDALARLMHAVDDDGTRFTDEELIPEAMALFFAGHDTTAKTLSWTMFLLDRHPAVLDDVLDELDDVVGARRIRAEDIPRLPLLDRVIKESTRILSSVPLLFLRVPQDEFEVGGVRLPRHANVVVSPLVTHHDPELYPRPRRFDPERWTGTKPPTYAYLPFGAGPRACVGGSFANQALRLIVPTVLQRVRPALVPGAKVSSLVRANIMRPAHGLHARLHPGGQRGLRAAAITGNIHELVEPS